MTEQTFASIDLDLTEVLENHGALLARLTLYDDDPEKDSTRRQDVLDEIERALEDLRRWAREMQTTKDFECLNDLASQWQTTCSRVVGRPRDIRAEIGLPSSPKDLEPTPRRFHAGEVDDHLRTLAHDISRNRKLGHVNQYLSRLMREPALIDRIDSTGEERCHDWYSACVCFASDVLNGDVHFVHQLEPTAFHHLEAVWISDIKQFTAYVAWEQDYDTEGIPKDAYYFGACEILHRRMTNCDMAIAPRYFNRIVDWCDHTYGKIDKGPPAQSPQLQRLIRDKADKIWQQIRTGSPDEHWHDAESFVLQFYRHIVPAICDKDEAATREVLAALRSDRMNKVDIVNAFEAALAIYGLDRQIVERYYVSKQSFV